MEHDNAIQHQCLQLWHHTPCHAYEEQMSTQVPSRRSPLLFMLLHNSLLRDMKYLLPISCAMAATSALVTTSRANHICWVQPVSDFLGSHFYYDNRVVRSVATKPSERPVRCGRQPRGPHSEASWQRARTNTHALEIVSRLIRVEKPSEATA